MKPPLQLEDVSLAFGGIKALSGVTLSMAHQVTGLIGPNGAGKSTCINVLTGFQRPDQGKVLLGETALPRQLGADRLCRMGISRTFQAGRLFKGLTVLENVAAACVGKGASRHRADLDALDILGWMGIAGSARKFASDLPYTEQRRVSIARALAGRPRYLLLDEPAAGMSEREAADLGDLVRKIHHELDASILLVEHKINLVLDVCESITVLDSGIVIEAGSPEHIRSSERVREAYLGKSLTVVRPEGRRSA